MASATSDGQRGVGGADADGVADPPRAGRWRRTMPSRAPERAAEQTEHGGLDQELAADQARRGAQGLAQADLADAFGDGHQHDVHDPDAADQQRDAGHPTQQDGQRLVDRGGGREQRLLRGDGEVGIGGRGDAVQG